MNNLTRGAVFGAACALCAIVAAGTAAAQNYPPGTNCQTLLPALRASCMVQVQQMNSGVGTSTVVPNSAGSNTVTTPGTGVTPVPGGVAPSGVAPTGVGASGTIVAPNGTTNPSGTANTDATSNGVLGPNGVTPNATINPNAVTPNGTVSPNGVTAPSANPIILPNNTGTGAAGAPGTIGTGVGAGTGVGTGTGSGAGGGAGNN